MKLTWQFLGSHRKRWRGVPSSPRYHRRQYQLHALPGMLPYPDCRRCMPAKETMAMPKIYGVDSRMYAFTHVQMCVCMYVCACVRAWVGVTVRHHGDKLQPSTSSTKII